MLFALLCRGMELLMKGGLMQNASTLKKTATAYAALFEVQLKNCCRKAPRKHVQIDVNDMALFTVKMMLECVHLEEQREIDKAAKSIATSITEIFEVSYL